MALNNVSLNLKSSDIDKNLLIKLNEICSVDNNFCIQSGKLKCNCCDFYFEKINSRSAKDTVKRHVRSGRHLSNLDTNKRKSSEDLSRHLVVNNGLKEFYFRLALEFISADIPLAKLKNKNLKDFLMDYTQHNVPEPS